MSKRRRPNPEMTSVLRPRLVAQPIAQPLNNPSDWKQPTESNAPLDTHESVFGPSHPLHALVAAHLPDVLASIVLAYQSPALPRQGHYGGHTVLPYGTWAFRDPRQQRMAANPLSLARRSFSWSGWMNRAPGGTRGVDDWHNHFLLSLDSHRSRPSSHHLHIGYRRHCHYATVQQNQCFTFAFNANDLDVQPHQADLSLFDGWEHWSGSFDYPPPNSTPPPPPPPPPHANQWYHYGAVYTPASTVLGRRKLYRNGVLLVEDDCRPLVADEHSTLILGNYQNSGHDMTLDGGVCDVRVYSRVLHEAEMRALYEGDEQAVSAEALEAHWPLQSDKHIAQAEGVSGTIVDVSGNERHLEVRTMNRTDRMMSRYQPSGQL